MNQRARDLLSLHRPQDALHELAKSFDPDDPLDWWLRGLAFYGLDRIDDALRASGNGLQLAPEHPLLLALVARCHSERRDLVAAEQATLAALRVNPEDADLLVLYGWIVAKAGQIDKARKLIAEARRLDPESADAVRLEAAIAAARFDHGETLRRGRELLALDPEDAHAHALTGEVLHIEGDIARAGEHLRTAVVSDPANAVMAEVARENLVWRHPLMWPLRPVHRFGPAWLWIAGMVVLVYTYATGIVPLMLIFGGVWVAYAAYSWVVPPIVRRLVK